MVGLPVAAECANKPRVDGCLRFTSCMADALIFQCVGNLELQGRRKMVEILKQQCPSGGIFKRAPRISTPFQEMASTPKSSFSECSLDEPPHSTMWNGPSERSPH